MSSVVDGNVERSPMWSKWLWDQMMEEISVLRILWLLLFESSRDATSDPGLTVVVALISETIFGA